MGAESELDEELGGNDLRDQLRGFRDQARRDAARSELDQLKLEMASRVLPARNAGILGSH